MAHLGMHWPVRAYLGLSQPVSGPVWTCWARQGLSGPVWAWVGLYLGLHLGLYGLVLAFMGLSGPVWVCQRLTGLVLA